MNLLVIGSGVREHALVKKIKKSPLCDEIYCIPGNPEIAEIAECADIDSADINALAEFAKEHRIALTVSSDAALFEAGLSEKFESVGLKIFGPSSKCAFFETVKSDSRLFLSRHDIPVPPYTMASNTEEGLLAVKKLSYPLVIKRDRDFTDNGVVICGDVNEAEKALVRIMKQGNEDGRVILEPFIAGECISVPCFFDGATLIEMIDIKEEKRLLDNDAGSVCGSMGAYYPVSFLTEQDGSRIRDEILMPLTSAIIEEGLMYRGVLTVNVILSEDGPKVLSMNTGLTDASAVVLMKNLESDLVEIMIKCTDSHLDYSDVVFVGNATVCVMCVTAGYPGEYKIGYDVTYKDMAEGAEAYFGNISKSIGGYVTSGPKVAAVCATSKKTEKSRALVYENINKIAFDNMYYRSDIARMG